MTILRTLAERDNWKCHYCYVMLTEKSATRDHVVARSRGGTNHIKNLVLCCHPCNGKKGDMYYKDFIVSEWLRGRRVAIKNSGLDESPPHHTNPVVNPGGKPRPLQPPRTRTIKKPKKKPERAVVRIRSRRYVGESQEDYTKRILS